MTRTRTPYTARRGFTLVELLVSTALVVLILTILAVTFGAATESLSKLRGTGDMAERLRATADMLRADLNRPHFEGDAASTGTQKLSDLRYDLLPDAGPNTLPESRPPRLGYFRIEQGSGSTFEGTDKEQAISSRASSHAMEFTVKREGKSPDDFFVVGLGTATNPPSSASESDVPLMPNERAHHWARVRWTLGNPQTVDGVTTFTLFRCVRVLTRQIEPIDASDRNGLPGDPPGGGELYSSKPGSLQTHRLEDVTAPGNRDLAPIAPYAPKSQNFGDDIVLTNVLSFEVKPAWDAPPAGGAGGQPKGRRSPRSQLPAVIGTAVPDGGGATVTNSEHPHDDLPEVTENTTLAGLRVFDTWGTLTGAMGKSWDKPNSEVSIPLRIRITALQVKLRVYDPKTQMTRQVTVIIPQ